MSANLLFGNGPRLEWRGRSFEIKPMTIAQLSEFSAWLESEVWASHKRSKKYLSQDAWDRKGALIDKDIALQRYSYPSEAFFESMSTRAGLMKVFQIIFRDSKQEIEEEELESFVDDLYEEALRATVRANTNPSQGRPETVAASPSA